MIQKWLAVAGQESEIRFIPLLGDKKLSLAFVWKWSACYTQNKCILQIYNFLVTPEATIWCVSKKLFSLAINLYTLQTTQKHSSSESFHFIRYWKIILLVFLTLKENQITVPMLWLWSDHLIYSPRVGSQENENYHIALI